MWYVLGALFIVGLLLPNWLHTRRAELRDRIVRFDPDLPLSLSPDSARPVRGGDTGRPGGERTPRPADHPNTHQEQHP